MTPQPQQEIDLEKLKEYLVTRAQEHQNKQNWDSSFECQYLITVINRGWYWNNTGRIYIRSRPHTSSTERDYHDDDCIWMTPEEEEKRIRAHERKETLDEVKQQLEIQYLFFDKERWEQIWQSLRTKEQP